MAGVADCEVDVLAAGHPNRLVHDRHVLPLTVELILVGVVRVDLLDEQVLYVRADVGQAPCDVAIVPDDYPRRPGEREATDIVTAAGVQPCGSAGRSGTRSKAAECRDGDRWPGWAGRFGFAARQSPSYLIRFPGGRRRASVLRRVTCPESASSAGSDWRMALD